MAALAHYFGPELSRTLDDDLLTDPTCYLWLSPAPASLSPRHPNYNLVVLRSYVHPVYVTHIQAAPLNGDVYSGHDLNDRYCLTVHGTKKAQDGKGNTIGASILYGCSGRGYGGGAADTSNCMRKCGRQGPGPCECEEQEKKGHGCGFHVKVAWKLEDIARRECVVQITGSHVPPQVVAIAPSLTSLRPDATTARWLTKVMMDGTGSATTACNSLRPALEEAAKKDGAQFVDNSRFNIDPKIVAGQVKRQCRLQMGEGLGKGDCSDVAGNAQRPLSLCRCLSTISTTQPARRSA